MLKKLASFVILCSGAAAAAGMVDHGDCTPYPWVMPYTQKAIIAFKYFPEITHLLPAGMSREDAWKKDLAEAAAGLNVDQAELDKLLRKIIHLNEDLFQPVKAPHPKLQEFALYVQGLRNLRSGYWSEMPNEWKQLMSLPVESRKYTTIPVIFKFNIHLKKHFGILDRDLADSAAMQKAFDQGCVDTQGCRLALIESISRFPMDYKDRQNAVKLLFRKQYTNYDNLAHFYSDQDPELLKKHKENRFYDRLFINGDAPDFVWYFYLESDETIRKMAQNDPVLRDLIVAIGLTNRSMPELRKIAWEFAEQSKINYPVIATRLPLDKAIKLLKGIPEYQDMHDLLVIKTLNGEEKIAAIDRYLAKYPDRNDNIHNKGVLLNSHAELNAMAGAELFKLGRPMEAAERWIKGCAPEDLGLVAEQVMSIDELIRFCERHFPVPVEEEQEVYSGQCSKSVKEYSWQHVISKKQINFMVRNLLARRLMRAGRFDEAEKYFTGSETRKLAAKFFAFRKVCNSKTASPAEKLNAQLNMAALTRFQGDKLFGTFLEPDNLICSNRNACIWGLKQKAVNLKKPDLPRYSYRYRAAAMYAQAAEMSSDPALKRCAIWTAGTILKNISPESADPYFKKLFAIAPELTVKNWFLPKKKVPADVAKFYDKTEF